MVTDMQLCFCKETEHPHHPGGRCDKPAVSPAEEIVDGPDNDLGAICLECYQLMAVDLHEEDPTAVLDLNVLPSFPICDPPLR